MILFTASRGNTFVGGTCALPSALLVLYRRPNPSFNQTSLSCVSLVIIIIIVVIIKQENNEWHIVKD